MNRILYSLIFLPFLSCSTQRDKRMASGADTAYQNISAADTARSTINSECYKRIKGKDTVEISYVVDNNIVKGQLVYNYFEKDKNSGAISGTFHGDTLLADYAFMSEGIRSVRQVIFLKKINTLTEGYADMEEKDKRMQFKNLSDIKFPDSILLIRTDCQN